MGSRNSPRSRQEMNPVRAAEYADGSSIGSRFTQKMGLETGRAAA